MIQQFKFLQKNSPEQLFLGKIDISTLEGKHSLQSLSLKLNLIFQKKKKQEFCRKVKFQLPY